MSPWLAGSGIARNLEVVVPWFAKRGHSVAVLAWNIQEELSGHPNPVLQTLHENAIPVIHLRSYGRLSSFQRAVQVAALAVRRRASIIVGYELQGNIVASVAKTLLWGQARTILEIHCASNIHSEVGTSPKLLTAARKLYQLADCVIAVSESIRDDTCRFFGLDPTRVITVYNPVPVAKVRALSNEPVKNPLPDDYILGCGRLVPPKGFADLIEAFGRLNHSSLKLVILGIGPFREELLRLAARLGVAERVLLPGYVPNPYPYFAGARAFVLPSHSEALPTVLVEAMACKTPVISSCCGGGSEEILSHGRYGQLYPASDVQALTARLTAVLHDTVKSAMIAQEALERTKDFSADSILPKLEQYIFGC